MPDTVSAKFLHMTLLPIGWPLFLANFSFTCSQLGDKVGNLPCGFSLLFGHFPKGLHYLVNISHGVSNTLLLQLKIRHILACFVHIAAFYVQFPWSSMFSLLKFKIEDAIANFKKPWEVLLLIIKYRWGSVSVTVLTWTKPADQRMSDRR